MIKITSKGKFPFVKMGKSDTLKTGDWVVAVGHPSDQRKGRPPVVRVGRVLSRSKSAIQTDCALVGDDSCGPLFNLDGEVIGIHSRINRPMNMNIHVPVNTYHETWDRLVAGESWGGFGDLFNLFKPGEGSNPIGFDIDRELRVTKVEKESAAGKAGLLVGDVLQKVNGKEVSTRDDAARHLARPQGGEITLVVDREGEPVTLTYRAFRRKGKNKGPDE